MIVVYGEKVIMRDSLRAALTEIFGSSPPTLELQGPGVPLPPVAGVGTPPGGGGAAPGPPGGVDATVQSLLDQATAKFTAADEALRKGDLAGYQRENDAAKALIQQAVDTAKQPTSGRPIDDGHDRSRSLSGKLNLRRGVEQSGSSSGS